MMTSSMTLKELAILSGFSVSTVSKALNDKHDVNSSTRQIILELAKKHHYTPNSYAIALRKQQTKVIAVILPKIHNTFYSALLCDVQKKASKLGFRILVFQSFDKPEEEIKHLRAINDGSVDGAIVFSINQVLLPIDGIAFPIEFLHVQTLQNSLVDLQKVCLEKLSCFLDKIH